MITVYNMGEILILLLPLIGFSVLAFWSKYAPFFMIVAGASLMMGLKLYDVFPNDTGMSIALMIIGYAFACLFLAYRYIFWQEEGEG